MKKNIIFGIGILLFILIGSYKVYATDEALISKDKLEKVDVVLFWGQSNMVGTAGRYDSEEKKDKRDLSTFIDSDILKQYKKIDYVSVEVPRRIAYEYKINSDGKGYFAEINSKTKYCGENLTYKNGKLYEYNEETKSFLNYKSLYKSNGTNMIPQFCKTYYEKTGRNIIVVMAARGGEEISHFLPSNTTKYSDGTDSKYIYEAMKTKYLGAISALKEKRIKIERQFYVVCQGENDSKSKLADKYYNTFLKVHNYLKEDLSLDFGVIDTTGHKINQYNKNYSYVKAINNAQKKLASNNSDIILGSNLGYKVYANKIKEAYCLEESYNNKDKNTYDNSIHLNSATLSQIGKDSANAVINFFKVYKSDQAPHFKVSINNNNIFYNVKDGEQITKYKIQNQKTGKYLITRTSSQIGKIDNISKKATFFNLNKNSNQKFYGIAYDNSGNGIKSEFFVERDIAGNYRVENAPEIYNITSRNKTVDIYCTASSEIYIKNLNDKKFSKQRITNIKNASGKDYSRFSVKLSEMTYKNRKYYLFVKAYGTTKNKLSSYQRIMLTEK